MSARTSRIPQIGLIVVLVLGIVGFVILGRDDAPEAVDTPVAPTPAQTDVAQAPAPVAPPADAPAVAPADAPADLGIAAAVTPPNSPWDRQWDRFKANMAAANIKMDYLLRGSAGNEETILSNLRRGRVAICGCSLQGLSGVVPELTVAMAPYLFDSAEEVDFVYDNYLAEPLDALFAEKGIKILEWTEVGWTDIFAQTPIVLPEDAAGTKLRGSPNLGAQAFLAAIGADAIALGSVDIVPGLQTGLIDGGLGNTAFMYFSVREYVTDITLTRHSYDTGAIVANLRWFEGLTPEQQQAVDDGFGSSDLNRGEVRDYINGLLVELRASEDITVHELSEDQRAAWVAASQPAIRDIIAAVGGEAQTIHDAILAGKAAFAAQQAAE